MMPTFNLVHDERCLICGSVTARGVAVRTHAYQTVVVCVSCVRSMDAVRRGRPVAGTQQRGSQGAPW